MDKELTKILSELYIILITMPKKPPTKSGGFDSELEVILDYNDTLFRLNVELVNQPIPYPIDMSCSILVRDKNYIEYYDEEPIPEYDEFWDREEEYQGQWLIKEEWFW